MPDIWIASYISDAKLLKTMWEAKGRGESVGGGTVEAHNYIYAKILIAYYRKMFQS